ncbi:Putative protein C11orf61 like protein [Chelonia mydas]|uniref:Myb/SANT-like DNA-binding domain-containing protein n=1 Tax=Chelonia mydas TaxID=8469 RepID=M7BTC9_CHEMY|nr:Putative protein C11orf61 like protein [Chelonia mydas]
MQSQNHQRGPAWTQREIWDLIAVWGDKSVLAELRSKRQNAKIFEKISNGMKDRGYNRDLQQCQMKIKELRQAYQKNREANGCYRSTHLCFDSIQGVGGNTEMGFGGEEDDDEEEVVDSSQQGSGETSFPNSQDCFSLWTWSQYPLNPPKVGSRTLKTEKAEKGPLGLKLCSQDRVCSLWAAFLVPLDLAQFCSPA